MKDTKPQPSKSKLELREAAKRLDERPINPDHPAALIFAEVQKAQAEAPPPTHLPPTTYHPPPTTQTIAPERDFTRVPNSIVRDAVPAGLFKGESKKLYDALYQRTRGSVVPRRSIRATQSDLMDWARVSHNTLRAHLKHLSKVGLINIHYVRGDNTGAEYEIFTPEEALSPTLHPPSTHPPPSTQNLGPPTTQILVGGGRGQVVEESTTYGLPNTSFNTNTEKTDDDDDAALAGLVSKLKDAAREITGRNPSPAESERWEELAGVLVAELKIAAARTTVSSVPSFLTEHLRRRLWKVDKRQARAEGRELPDEAMKTAPSLDASQCPDCGGSGWWYPEGLDKGVKKCKHDKLTSPGHSDG
jgi:hypothetical protein